MLTELQDRQTARGPGPAKAAPARKRIDARRAVVNYVNAQSANARRHGAAVRAFRAEDFGNSPSAPRATHLAAVNALLARSGAYQARAIAKLERSAGTARTQPSTSAFVALNNAKGQAARRTRITEQIWLFYLHLFDQRIGPFGDKLLAMDRIALDCYQACYVGLGKARSIPTPPPFSYVEAGYGPATYRRGVLVSKIARNPNPFPLVKLPYTRLINPWSLGAVPHEIGHNLQSDLNLWKAVPRQIRAALSRAGIPRKVAATWERWHKETYADLIGVLLIGPAYVASLMDVVGKPASSVARFRANAVHPTSYLRVLINCHLLRRMGFGGEAAAYQAAWRSLYPAHAVNAIPAEFRRHFQACLRIVVTVMCFTPHPAYGDRRLVDVVRFRPQDAGMVAEAAERLSHRRNPGILPERFLIAAVREALDRRLAPPATLTDAFYQTLLGR